MRIPLATDLKTRTGAPDKDARQKNSYIEVKNEQAIVRKRPSAQGGVSVGTGTAQGGYGLVLFWADTAYPITETTGTDWNGATPYVIGDHVSVGFVDYWALENNTGSQPPSGNWSGSYVPAVGTLISYATFGSVGSLTTLSNGNLTATTVVSGANNRSHARASISKTSGKWYVEITIANEIVPDHPLHSNASGGYTVIGIARSQFDLSASNYTSIYYAGQYNFTAASSDPISMDGTYAYIEGAPSAFGKIGSFNANGDIVGIAVDLDGNMLNLYKNGVLVLTQAISNNDFYIVVGYQTDVYSYISYPFSSIITANFGATPFTYSVPSGYNSGLYT